MGGNSTQSCRLVAERVIVRLPEEWDVRNIIRYFKENERHLARFGNVYSEGLLTQAFWLTEVDRRRKEFLDGVSCKTFLFRRVDDAEVIGSANLSEVVRGYFQAAYLGYALAEKEQGKGLMHEALSLLIEFAFSKLNLHRIMANYVPSNERSRAVLERLGFIIEGTAKNYLLINGVWEDHVLTSLTNPNWKNHGKGHLR